MRAPSDLSDPGPRARAFASASPTSVKRSFATVGPTPPSKRASACVELSVEAIPLTRPMSR
jgi:hypothetical protein